MMIDNTKESQLREIAEQMREFAKRWDYDQHDERDVIAWAEEIEALTAGVPPAESDVIRAMLWPLLGLKPTVDTLGAAMKRINELSAGVPPEPSQEIMWYQPDESCGLSSRLSQTPENKK